jgi:hypothetical protein
VLCHCFKTFVMIWLELHISWKVKQTVLQLLCTDSGVCDASKICVELVELQWKAKFRRVLTH